MAFGKPNGLSLLSPSHKTLKNKTSAEEQKKITKTWFLCHKKHELKSYSMKTKNLLFRTHLNVKRICFNRSVI